MGNLSLNDIRAFNRAVLELHATQTAAEFPARVHAAVRCLFSTGVVVMDCVDPRTSISRYCGYSPDNVITDELNVLGHILLPHQFPRWLEVRSQAIMLADFISRREWHLRDIYHAFHNVGVEDSLSINLVVNPGLVIMVCGLRSGFASYTQEERDKLDLLGPHVLQVYLRLMAQGEVLSEAAPVRRQMQMVVSSDGRVREWSSSVAHLLADFGLRISGTELPARIRDWFREQRRKFRTSDEASRGPQPISFHRLGHRLRIHLALGREAGTYYLALQEVEITGLPTGPLSRFGVSRREAEVLDWLSRGKTNSEIGVILNISAGTVRRHLENVFPKLGVENRLAAALVIQEARESFAMGEIPK